VLLLVVLASARGSFRAACLHPGNWGSSPGKWFQGKLVNKKKTRKIKHDHFPKLPHVQQLIKIFENLHNDMRVTEVWFLKKKDKGDGFEEFHFDCKNI
jgi:hypothetical protein